VQENFGPYDSPGWLSIIKEETLSPYAESVANSNRGSTCITTSHMHDEIKSKVQHACKER